MDEEEITGLLVLIGVIAISISLGVSEGFAVGLGVFGCFMLFFGVFGGD